jgi:hypothetical protein
VDDDFRRIFRNSRPSEPRNRNAPNRFSELLRVFRTRRRLLISALAAAAAVGALIAVLVSATPGAGTAAKNKSSKGESRDSHNPQGHFAGVDEESDADTATPPRLEDLGGNRYRGPSGTIVKVPRGWEITAGNQIELWATLVPAGSKDPIPRIGIGNISAEGLEPQDALDTVGYYLSEVLPEITSTEEPFRGGILSKGSGTVEGKRLDEVRWMYPLSDGVLVVWGLFPAGYPGKVDLVTNAVEPPPA